jgi:hypothetical protein
MRKRDKVLTKVIESPILFLDSDEIMDQSNQAKKRLFSWLID